MEDQKEIEPRYMTQGKKQYYLASVDENMTQLLRGEIDSLTKVLIELKSQYDDLTRESNVKKMKTVNVKKQQKLVGGNKRSGFVVTGRIATAR